MRPLVYVALVGAALYAVLALLVYACQHRLLYLPDIMGGGLDATPADVGLAFEDVHITTADGVRVHAWFVPAPGSPHVVLHFHGNGGNISHRIDALRALHDAGLGVLAVDYRGYGLSEGAPSEAGTYLDAEAAWRHLIDARGYTPEQVIVYGYSLGAAIAAHLARQVRPAALILEAPFTSVPDVAAHHYWFLPVRWLSRFRYPTAEYVREVASPVLVIHSREDEVVPFDHGVQVYDAAAGPKELVEIEGDHASGSVFNRHLFLGGLQRFIAQHVPARASQGAGAP